MRPQLQDLSTPLAYALAYARLGWHVFPVERGAKVPVGRLVPRGHLEATTDEAIIRRWWRLAPDAGIGVSLSASGLAAIDVDPRNGGNETMDDLERAHGSLRSDVYALTGGGGEHHVFLLPAGMHPTLPGTLGPGVDVKVNGYIVVEPSVHASGRTYQWEASSSPLDGMVPSALPDWLRSFSRASDAQETPRTGTGKVASGGRNNYLSRKAYGMRRLGLAIEHIEAALTLVNRDECDPPLPEEEVRSIARGKLRVEPEPLAFIGRESIADGAALPLVYAEDVSIETIGVQQIVEDTITAGGLSVMYGESNSGKSFLACDMDCSLAAGIPWLGRRTVQGAVMYVAGEGSESIKMRVLAWRQHHGINPMLAVVPVAVNLLDPHADVGRVIEAAAAVSEHYGMPVVKITIDTLARAFGGGNENASEDMGAVIANADRIRAATKAHVMAVHHAGKDASKGSRGHSSLKAATDTEIEVTADEATKIHTARITKQRDLGSRGQEMTAKFSVVEMGKDQWGKAVTTCVVDATDAKPTAKASKKRGAELREAIRDVLLEQASRTMKRGELVKRLIAAGYTSSPIYRAILDMAADGEVSEHMNMIHLSTPKVGF